MKYLLLPLFTLVFFSLSFAQKYKEEIVSPPMPKPLKLSAFSYTNALNFKEKFFLLYEEKQISTKQWKDEAAGEFNSPVALNVQNENTKIGGEIFYFLGAAALAAIIYFLIPDDIPPSKTVYTFGLPVTPK